MSPRQDRSEVEQLRAALAAERAERERLADKLAQVLDHMYTASILPVTADGTGPVPRVPHRKVKARTPRDKWWLAPVPVVAAIAAVRRAVGTAHPASALGVPVTAVALTAAVMAMPPAHTLEDRTPYTGTVPSASSPAVPVVVLPQSRLSSNTGDQPVLRSSRKPLVRHFAAVAPMPAPVAVPVPVVTSSPPAASWSAPVASSVPSASSQSSQSSSSSRWQAQGQHASGYSRPGNGGYQPQHGHNDSGSNYWQQGSGQGSRDSYGQNGGQQGGTWQNSSSRNANWQQGNQQSASWQGGQQQGGWQGNGGGHGNRGGH